MSVLAIKGSQKVKNYSIVQLKYFGALAQGFFVLFLPFPLISIIFMLFISFFVPPILKLLILKSMPCAQNMPLLLLLNV